MAGITLETFMADVKASDVTITSLDIPLFNMKDFYVELCNLKNNNPLGFWEKYPTVLAVMNDLHDHFDTITNNKE